MGSTGSNSRFGRYRAWTKDIHWDWNPGPLAHNLQLPVSLTVLSSVVPPAPQNSCLLGTWEGALFRNIFANYNQDEAILANVVS